MTDAVTKFDEEEASNLLKNFRLLVNIRNIKVPNNSIPGFDLVTIEEWAKSFRKKRLWSVCPEVVDDVLMILDKIDANNKLLLNRTEEMIARISAVADRKDAMLKDRDVRIKELEELVTIIKVSEEDIPEKIEVPIIEDKKDKKDKKDSSKDKKI